jgi:hypothetical protein
MGISISEYDEMTPYELSLFARIYNEKQKNEQEDKLTLVWLGEHWHRIKKLPSLNEALGKKDKPKKQMTDNEMLEVVKKLNAKFGGSVEGR